jgi:hypothetical protein
MLFLKSLDWILVLWAIYTFFLHDLLISLCMQLIYIRRLGQLICSETLLFNLLDIGYNT